MEKIILEQLPVGAEVIQWSSVSINGPLTVYSAAGDLNQVWSEGNPEYGSGSPDRALRRGESHLSVEGPLTEISFTWQKAGHSERGQLLLSQNSVVAAALQR